MTKRIKRILVVCITGCMMFMLLYSGNTLVYAKDKIGLSSHSEKLYDQTYDNLESRISNRGYAATSLTGAYPGMFIRDSSIQVMAHTRYGDYYHARNILDYLLRYHQALQAESAVHIIPDLDDIAYNNSFVEIGDEVEVPEEQYYEYQLKTSDALFGLNQATQNGGGITFTTKDSTLESISAYISTSGAENDEIYASLRTDIKNEKTEIAKVVVPITQTGWQKIAFDKAINVTPGEKYYLFVQSNNPGVAMFGSVTAPDGFALQGYNYDVKVNGGFVESAWPAFKINDNGQEIKQQPYMSNTDYSIGLFKINNLTHNSAFGFIPNVESVSHFRVYLTGSGEATFTLTTDPTDPKAAIKTVSKTISSNGWHEIHFGENVKVVPNQKYYVHIATTSGEIIAYGSIASSQAVPSLNWENNVWSTTPYAIAFEMFTETDLNQLEYALPVSIKGDSISGIEVMVESAEDNAVLKGELRENLNGSKLISAQTILKKGVQNAKIEFNQEIKVNPNQVYYFVLSAEAKHSVNWNYNPAVSKISYQFEEGVWKEIPLHFTYKILPEYSGEYRVPIFMIGDNQFGVQEIPSKGEHVTAIDVILGNNKQKPGQATASLYKKEANRVVVVDEQVLDISHLSTSGDVVHIEFRLPIEMIDQNASYFLKISAKECEKDMLTWFGSKQIDQYVSENNDGIVKGEASYVAYKSDVRKLSEHRQIDGNYMLIHAWCMFAKMAPDTKENREFIIQTYPIIKRFADSYLKQGYINMDNKLIKNDSFEHSREGRYWNSYDLITNTFTSQALHELSAIALTQNDEESSIRWNEQSEILRKGIESNLVTEVDGKKIYAELYDIDNNMKLVQGMSWVNWAPMAAQWYAMDEKIMQNTYDIYQKYGSQDYQGYRMLDVVYDMETKGFGNHVIGKGLAWEIMFNHGIDDVDKSNMLVAFILDNSTENGVYPETYQLGGTFSDVGNQEHASWQHYAMSYAYPQLTKSYQIEHLLDLIEKVETMDMEEYTDESVELVNDCVLEARYLLRDETTSKKKLKDMIIKLEKAVNELQEKTPVDPVLPNDGKVEDEGTNTGDTTNIVGMFVLLGLAGFAITYIVRKRMK